MRRPLASRVCAVSLLLAIVAACGSSDNAGPGPTVNEGSEAVLLLAASSADRAAVDPDAPIAELAAGFNNAGFDLLRTQAFDSNVVLSPVSVGHALLMARGAADDETGANIDAALALPIGMSAHEAWNSVDQMIAAAGGGARDVAGEPSPVIAIADRIWPASGVNPDQEWIDLLASHHGSDVASIDVGQPELSRRAINGWVSDATESLIPELLPTGFINGNTTLVLTDAVYFKAQWQTIFGKYGTTVADFTRLDGTTIPITFMRDLENQGERGTGDGWTAADLPYLGGDFSMLVIIPDEGRFEEIRSGLDHGLLNEIDSDISPGPYELLLPKWAEEVNIDLLPWLTEIGAAPGSYPAITPGSFLSGGVHAADIEVDELGTVAAAATGLGFEESGPPEPELLVAADKPFFYVIRHDATGIALFAGQVTDPAD